VTNEDLLDLAPADSQKTQTGQPLGLNHVQGYLESTNYGIIPEGNFTGQQTAQIPYPAEMDLSEVKG
jgi:hypothetical protein